MEQAWREAKGLFAVVFTTPVLWLFAFFLAPLAIIWAYSFGRNEGLTAIVDRRHLLANYAHALNPLYLSHLPEVLLASRS